jgi:hypothetical protein
MLFTVTGYAQTTRIDIQNWIETYFRNNPKAEYTYSWVSTIYPTNKKEFHYTNASTITTISFSDCICTLVIEYLIERRIYDSEFESKEKIGYSDVGCYKYTFDLKSVYVPTGLSAIPPTKYSILSRSEKSEQISGIFIKPKTEKSIVTKHHFKSFEWEGYRGDPTRIKRYGMMSDTDTTTFYEDNYIELWVSNNISNGQAKTDAQRVLSAISDLIINCGGTKEPY